MYDLLDRRYFEPIPIFLDAFHRFVRFRPRYLYYGMLSDFFPSAELFPAGVRFPLYAEQVAYPDSSRYMQALTRLGPILPVEALSEAIDVAFLVLHGLGGGRWERSRTLRASGVALHRRRLVGQCVGHG